MYKVEYSPEFCSKYFDKLPSDCRTRIKRFLEQRVAVFPHEEGYPLSGTLSGLWAAHVGVYRIIYEIHKDRVVVKVIKIGHRKNVYQRK